MKEEYLRFIESWGSMGIFWGINRSMARIHAYILVSDSPCDLDVISKDLNISRGNASMCLKELRNWGVIQRVHISGDRKDYYTSENDSWKMFFRIATERKKREFDPALATLRDLMGEVDTEKEELVHSRLQQIEEILSTLDGVLSKFMEDEKKSKLMLDFFKNFGPK